MGRLNSHGVDVADLPVSGEVRELCHDLIEPAATIRWLVCVAGADPAKDHRDVLAAIGVAAGQIATICEHVLGEPGPWTGVRLDRLAADAVVSAQARYAGTIEVISRPVTVRAHAADIVRILGNLLTNACRAAGPDGRVRLFIDASDGQARLAVTDSGNGLRGAAPRGRAGLGLEIIGALALDCGGSVHLGVGDLGGLSVTVRLPEHGGCSS
jgi:hypothetical protein